ncbi:MAG: response regulator [Verrucomicrobia bacterium]|nr:MAG: response regulator [Verrucomicrobiota bacterium]
MQKRILIIDDEADFVELLQYRLQRDQVEFQVASNGLEAMNLARAFDPHLILLDVLLPDLDGLTLCSILRNDATTRETPIFIMSGVNTEVTRYSALIAGAQEFFGKPVDFAVFEATVERALGLKLPETFNLQPATLGSAAG